MTTAQACEKLASELKLLMFDDDDAASDVLHYTSWQAMEDFENVMVGVMFADGTGMAATSGIYLGTDAAETSMLLVKAFSNPTTVDAVGDWRFAEISAEQVAQAGAENSAVYTHFSAGITADASGDEFAVVYIMKPGRFSHTGLTADVTA